MHDSAAPTTNRLALRARALALFATGSSAPEVAAALAVPLGTAKSWRTRYLADLDIRPPEEQLAPEDNADGDAAPLAVAGEVIPADASGMRRMHPDASPKISLAALVARYLEAGLETLIAQHDVIRDPEWIRKQPAGELAVLRGVEADKIVKILQLIDGRQG